MDNSLFFHAWYSYKGLGLYAYIRALFDLLWAKITGMKNITFHLPIEIVLPSRINIEQGNSFINFVETISKKMNVEVMWENIAFLSTKDWSLIEQGVWTYIPRNINLCLDTGHLMLGEKYPKKKIKEIIKKYGRQIKHLHIHENDLIHDHHLFPQKIVDKKLLKEIVRGRTWIIEPES